MVSFWVNNRSFDVFESFTSGHALKGPLSKEDVLSLVIAFNNQSVSELDLNDWCSFPGVASLFPDDQSIILFQFLQTYSDARLTFVDVRYFIVMLFLLTYQPYVCEESMRYDNLLQSFAEFYDVDESVTYTNLAFETKENARITHRSAFVFDNLLFLFVCLFYSDFTDHSISELVSRITEGDYSFFLDGFVIRTDSLRYLSMILCAGQSSGEEQPLESLFPESLQDETDLYNPFDFIVFIEQNMERVTIGGQMEHAKVNGIRYIVCQKQQDILVPSSIITPSVQVIKNVTDGSIEDPNLYSYPLSITKGSFTTRPSSSRIAVASTSSSPSSQESFSFGIVRASRFPSAARESSSSRRWLWMRSSSCFQVMMYLYTPSNPLLIASPPSHVIVAPYNIPRPHLTTKLIHANLVGRNCWDYGIDINGYCVHYSLLPPEQFSPFMCQEALAGNNESYELPLLPTEYEDAMKKVNDRLRHRYAK